MIKTTKPLCQQNGPIEFSPLHNITKKTPIWLTKANKSYISKQFDNCTLTFRNFQSSYSVMGY